MVSERFRADLAQFEARARASIGKAVRLRNWLMLESLDRWLEQCPASRQEPVKSFRSAS